MEEYVNFSDIIDYLNRFADTSRFVNSFGYGNLIDYGKTVDNTVPLYPLLFVTPQTITYNQNTTTYGCQIIIADRLNDDLENSKDIISECQMIGRDLIGQIKRGEYADLFDFDFPVSAQPFQERFNDVLAGVSIDMNIEVSDFIDICEIEDDLKYKLVLSGEYDEDPNVAITLSKTDGSGNITYPIDKPSSGATGYTYTVALDKDAIYSLTATNVGSGTLSILTKVGGEIIDNLTGQSSYSLSLNEKNANYTINISKT